MPARSLPTGTVTFLFTDIEGSTSLVQRLGAAFRPLLEDHNRLLRTTIQAAGGVAIRTEGDAVFAVFSSAPAAVGAAIAAQRALAGHAWPDGTQVRVRMGLHTGEGALGGDDYVGLDVHLAARIAATGHGGQIVVSESTRRLAERDLPADAPIVNLGEHRLKDFPDPQRLYQVAVEPGQTFPPLRSVHLASNLPEAHTSFVGRQAALTAITDRIGNNRLVTLTGPGGAGKTRLALEVTTRLQGSFPDGAAFVDLAPLGDPEQVPGAIASGLGLRSVPGAPLDVVASYLRDREQLLVLDNFEHLLPAAPDVGRLLSEARGVKVLATSRSPLSLAGEQVMPVPPLELPEPGEDAASAETVRLFAERAAAVDPSFVLDDATARIVAEICARLDGLPLAIELAAARVQVLPPEALRARLERRLPTLTGGARDAPARHRTLRETIAWGHDLLGEDERAMLRGLSVFAGGWTLEAAEAVTNPAGALGDSLDLLSVLVQASVVRRQTGGGEPRFGMLETIREFATEQLEASPEAEEVRARHAERYLGLAAAAGPHLIGDDQEEWATTLDAEADNVRTALAWAVDRDRAEPALAAIAGVWRFWQFRGRLAEGRRWADAVLALPSASPRTGVRGRALIAAAGIDYWMGDYERMEARYREAIAIGEAAGDPALQGEALFGLAFAAQVKGERREYQRCLERSWERFAEVGDLGGMGRVRMAQAFVEVAGEIPDTRRAREAVDLLARADDRLAWTDAMHMLATGAARSGDLDEAGAIMGASLDRSRRIGDRSGLILSLTAAAYLANVRGAPLDAARFVGARESLSEAFGVVVPQGMLDTLQVERVAEESLGSEAFDKARGEGRTLTMEQAIALAMRTFGPGAGRSADLPQD